MGWTEIEEMSWKLTHSTQDGYKFIITLAHHAKIPKKHSSSPHGGQYYFTKYNMNGYDPLLAEFYTQNDSEYGGFPRLDFFINAKVRQTRIFLMAEHFNSLSLAL